MHPLSFIRGALFGAFVMYLFAPRSGAETRKMFAQKGEDLKNTLGDIAGSVTNDVTSQQRRHDRRSSADCKRLQANTYQQQP